MKPSLAILLFSLSASFVGCSQPGDHLEFPNGRTHTLGRIAPGASRDFEIPVRNGGAETIEITEIAPACSCVQLATKALRIPPGETRMVTGRSTRTMEGQRNVGIGLRVGRRLVGTLILHYEIHERVTLSSDSLVRLDAEPGAYFKQAVEFTVRTGREEAEKILGQISAEDGPLQLVLEHRGRFRESGDWQLVCGLSVSKQIDSGTRLKGEFRFLEGADAVVLPYLVTVR